MHTQEFPNGIRIHYNGDYSGDIVINDDKGNKVELPMENLVEFVNGSMRDHIISVVESMKGKDIIALYNWLDGRSQ